jgi:quercetin dioxygenase-like cupin family protein
MRRSRLPDKQAFSSERFLPTLVYGSERVRAFLLCLEPGQGLPVRADSEEMVCCVLEGRGKVTVGEEVEEVRAGDLVGAAPGEARGIEAEERLVALWVQVSAESGGDG